MSSTVEAADFIVISCTFTMANFIFHEQANMIFIYSRANGNARAARLYAEVYPDR